MAITYYAVLLLAYLGRGLALYGLSAKHDLVAALLIVPVFIVLYVYLRRERHRLVGE